MENCLLITDSAFSDCHTVVNVTKIPVRSTLDDAYSGKAHRFTIKCQLIYALSGQILNVYGPVMGAFHDIEIGERVRKFVCVKM